MNAISPSAVSERTLDLFLILSSVQDGPVTLSGLMDRARESAKWTREVNPMRLVALICEAISDRQVRALPGAEERFSLTPAGENLLNALMRQRTEDDDPRGRALFALKYGYLKRLDVEERDAALEAARGEAMISEAASAPSRCKGCGNCKCAKGRVDLTAGVETENELEILASRFPTRSEPKVADLWRRRVEAWLGS